MPPFFHSLRCRLFILVLVALLPALGMIILDAFAERRQAAEDARLTLRRLVLQTSREQLQILRGARQLVQALAQMGPVRRHEAGAGQAVFQKIISESKIYRNIGAIALDGDIFSSAIPLEEPVNVSDRPYFQAVLRHKNLQVSGLLVGRISGLPSLTFAYPSLDQAGQVQAVVFAAVDMTWITALAIQAKLPEGAVLATIDEQGAILCRYPDPKKWAGVSYPADGLFTVIRQQGQGVVEAVGVDNQPRLYAFAPIGEERRYGYVLAGLPLSEVYDEANQTFWRNIAGLAIILLFSLGLAWFFSARWLLRPMAALSRTAAQLTAGDYGARTRPGKGPEELRRLGDAFDRLAAGLEQRETQRQQAMDRLSILNRLYLVRSRINEMLVRAHSPEELYEQVVNIAVTQGQFRMAWLGLVDHEKKVVAPLVHSGRVDGYLDNVVITLADELAGRGPTGTAAREGRVVVVNDWERDPRVAVWKKPGLERGYRSSAAIPLGPRDRVAAVLSLYADMVDFFTADEIAMLNALADDLSFGLAALEQEKQRRQGERALQETSARLEAIFRSSPAAIYVLDPQGRATMWNQASEDIFGWQAPEVLGQPLPFIPPEKVEEHASFQRLLFEQHEALLGRETRRLKKDGSPVFISMSASPFADAQGRILGAVVVVLDITARKLAEEQLQQYARELDRRVRERTLELQAANKELEAFAYSISHDLRAPLRAVSGFAQIIARRHRDGLNAEGQRYVDNIVLGGERMGQLIDDLLSYSRLGRQAITIKPVPLAKILPQVLSDFGDRVAATGAVVSVPPDLPVVAGDATLLQQIFTNLLDNALLYHRPEVPPEIRLTWRDANHHVVVQVADNGIGIEPEYQEKIFNVFQRLHSADDYPGTGIGLAIVKKAVDILKGRIWVESVPHQGSTFHIELPKE